MKNKINYKKLKLSFWLLISLVFLICLVILFVPIKIAESILVEEYCRARVNRHMEVKAEEFLKPTEEELKYDFMKGAGNITLSFRQQLKCEKNILLPL